MHLFSSNLDYVYFLNIPNHVKMKAFVQIKRSFEVQCNRQRKMS